MAHPILSVKNLDYTFLKGELKLSKDEQLYFDQYYKAYLGDFWQDGQATLLPTPNPVYKEEIDILMEERYISRNVLKECTNRVSNAFLISNQIGVIQSMD